MVRLQRGASSCGRCVREREFNREKEGQGPILRVGESEPLLERASVEFAPKGFQADGGIEWRRARLGLRGCVWVHAMQAAQVEPSSLSHKGLAGWLGWLAGWLWVQGRRPYAKPGSQCLKGADWLAGTS